ncbi:MAG: molybdate ABC transporter substrate-binding protein [Desulfovibrionales bacterium]
MYRLLLTFATVLWTASPLHADELIVSAAASLTDAMTDIKPAFERVHPGTTVTFNFASSGSLFAQIRQGAPVDVFASANQKWMDKAEDTGFLLQGTRGNFAANSLVLATPADNPAGIKSLEDLAGERVGRVAIGTPEAVPAGMYAKGALERAGLYSTLQPKYIFGESVLQVLDYLSRGEVDAGFVYATDAKKGGDKVLVITDIPLETPVSYPVAVVKESTQPQLAETFIDFLRGPEGRELLEARGFKTPSE